MTNKAAAELARPQHHLQLERLAAKALAAGDALNSFKFADRRCRIAPSPPAHCYVLRAEASWRLNRVEAALADLMTAIEIAPHDLGANRRMLAWSTGHRRENAARQILAHDTDAASLRVAIAALREAGERNWAAISTFDTTVSGWIAWSDGGEIEVQLAGDSGSLSSLIQPDPFHPLASSETAATAFRMRRPLSRVSQMVTLKRDGTTFQSYRLPPNLGAADSPRPESSSSERHSPATRPTVIVPVYGDMEATIACLDSLCRVAEIGEQRPRGSPPKISTGRAFRILVVDDATPELELKRHLHSLAADHVIELLVNPVNLGFIGAVNRALAAVTDGDIVLLNSDTLVPLGAIDRLAAAAYSAPNIGTVTPLSNNGEFFSFPKPNAVNPLPGGLDGVGALDRAAAGIADAEVIDMPSGIGFCLYVKRACLDRIGGLSDQFHRGYLEDVDFCLRARAAGFRNVCAPSVFVGHHGSRSFQQSKRSLVLRNLDILDRRFPGYRNECRAVETTDPLAPARITLEAALPDAFRADVLIAAGRGALRVTAEARARQLADDGERSVLLVPDGRQLRLIAADGGVPQSSWIRLDSPDAITEADAVLTRLGPSRFEMIDPNAPSILADIARRRGIKIEHWIVAGESLLGNLRDGEQLFAPSDNALSFARVRPGHHGQRAELRTWHRRPLTLPTTAETTATLAIVPAMPSAQSWQTVRMLSQHLLAFDPEISIVVAGETFDDHRLMSFPNVFVTGALSAEELPEAVIPHNPAWILTDFETPLFGHPSIEAARQAPRPVAYRDWSSGMIEPRAGDLAIAGDADDEALAVAVTRWIAGA